MIEHLDRLLGGDQAAVRPLPGAHLVEAKVVALCPETRAAPGIPEELADRLSLVEVARHACDSDLIALHLRSKDVFPLVLGREAAGCHEPGHLSRERHADGFGQNFTAADGDRVPFVERHDRRSILGISDREDVDGSLRRLDPDVGAVPIGTEDPLHIFFGQQGFPVVQKMAVAVGDIDAFVQPRYEPGEASLVRAEDVRKVPVIDLLGPLPIREEDLAAANRDDPQLLAGSGRSPVVVLQVRR